MKMNISEIAKHAGVSIATVSRALNNSSAINQETRKKVLQVAEEFNYKPNPIARSLSKQRTETVGVILPEMNEEFFAELLGGIDEEAFRLDYFLMLSSYHQQRNIAETFSEFLNSGRVDGVMLMADILHRDLLSTIKKSERPVILLNTATPIGDFTCFNINYYQGALALIDHLHEHGHRCIAFISGLTDFFQFDELFRGYEAAHLKHELKIREEFIIKGQNTQQFGYTAFMRLAHDLKDIDAIFCANDIIAAGVYEAARSLNVRIPQDIPVVGFGNLKLSQYLVPKLTTVHIPFYELGNKAMQHLLKMIDGNVARKSAYKKELTTGLVIGGSCGWHGMNF
jgi:LacI family transcriptional regulator